MSLTMTFVDLVVEVLLGLSQLILSKCHLLSLLSLRRQTSKHIVNLKSKVDCVIYHHC